MGTTQLEAPGRPTPLSHLHVGSIIARLIGQRFAWAAMTAQITPQQVDQVLVARMPALNPEAARLLVEGLKTELPLRPAPADLAVLEEWVTACEKAWETGQVTREQLVESPASIQMHLRNNEVPPAPLHPGYSGGGASTAFSTAAGRESDSAVWPGKRGTEPKLSEELATDPGFPLAPLRESSLAAELAAHEAAGKAEQARIYETGWKPEAELVETYGNEKIAGLFQKLMKDRWLSPLDLFVASMVSDDVIDRVLRGEKVAVHVLDRMFIALDRERRVREHDTLNYLRETFAIDGWDPKRCLALLRHSGRYTYTPRKAE